MLVGVLRPTAGRISVLGGAADRETMKRVGYLPEERGLYKKEKVMDVMTYFGRLKGMDRHSARQWSLAYLDRVDLSGKAATQVDKLSSGEQQKVQLGVTIMNRPELLILDEPTKGFDPVNRRLLMDIIAEQKNDGATVVMVTHQMEEVERLCDRIILLKDGTSEAYGTIDEVQNKYGGRVVRIRHTGPIPPSPHYEVTLEETNYAELSITDDTDEAAILRELMDAGMVIRSFTTTKISMEDIYIRVYGEHNESPSPAPGRLAATRGA
jgi:ABC-2 type transport system ATP-binding protein